LEYSLAKQRPSEKACLLGDSKWRKFIVLAGLVAVTQPLREMEELNCPWKDSQSGHISKGERSLETCRSKAVVASMENIYSGAKDPRGL
jgi:hypothetical protein